jgi:hypothetical protein
MRFSTGNLKQGTQRRRQEQPLVLLYFGFVNQHDWDVVANGINPMAFYALESVAIRRKPDFLFTQRASENF